MISSKILCDSVNIYGRRLITFETHYPRPIHAQVMAHKILSKNSGSGRAKPNSVFTSESQDHYYPDSWRKNQSGMQPKGDIDPHLSAEATKLWEDAIKYTLDFSQKLSNLGVHKEICNRPLEWFTYIDVVITSDSWLNFFALRLDENAQYEIRVLAESMWENYCNSTPTLLLPGQVHTPYVTKEERKNLDKETIKKISTARCARVSYKPFDMDSANIEKDLQLFEKLFGGNLKHSSPAEHVATATLLPIGSGNFRKGWRQFRKEIKDETITSFKGYKE